MAMERVLNPPLSAVGSLEGNSLASRFIAGLRAIMQRLMRAPAAVDAPLRLEARLNLGPKKSLVLVNCCGKRVLLALSGDTIVPVVDLPKQSRAKAVVGKGESR
jgi:flagellar biogenesis protein FliO